MARVNILDFVEQISKESITHPEVGAVKVDGKKDLPKNVTDDVPQENPREEVDAEVSDTKTSQPGPANGGGDGTAEFNSAEKAKTAVNTKDLHFDGDQNGGRERDQAPNKVKAKDGLSSSDIRTSVEEHEVGAEVSELETIDTGGAEGIEPADELVMDVDAEVDGSEVTGILSQSEIDSEVMGKILKDVGELEKAKASVERYIGILDSMERRGVEMSNELRKSISIGLESISEDLFKSEIITLEEYRVSNEANDVAVTGDRGQSGRGDFVDDDDDTEFDGARDKTSKGLKGKLKQIWEAIKRAFHRSVNALVDLYQSFTTDTTKLSEHLKGLRKRVSPLEGGKEMALKNASRLKIGDEFVGLSPEAIKRVTKTGKELLLDWPTKLVSILEEIKKGTGFFANADTAEVLQKFDDAITGSFRGLKSLSPKDKGKVPSGLLDVESLSWSDILPGNRALYVGIKRTKGAHGELSEANNFSDTVKINFSAVPALETDAGGATVVTPTAGEATQVIRALEELINQINGRKEGMVAVRKLAAEAQRAANSDIWTKGFSDSSIYSMVIANGIASATTSGEHAFIGYLISMIKAYIGFLEGSIKVETGDTKENTIDA